MPLPILILTWISMIAVGFNIGLIINRRNSKKYRQTIDGLNTELFYSKLNENLLHTQVQLLHKMCDHYSKDHDAVINDSQGN